MTTYRVYLVDYPGGESDTEVDAESCESAIASCADWIREGDYEGAKIVNVGAQRLDQDREIDWSDAIKQEFRL